MVVMGHVVPRKYHFGTQDRRDCRASLVMNPNFYWEFAKTLLVSGEFRVRLERRKKLRMSCGSDCKCPLPLIRASGNVLCKQAESALRKTRKPVIKNYWFSTNARLWGVTLRILIMCRSHAKR